MEEFRLEKKFNVDHSTRQAKDIVSDYRDGSYFVPSAQREYSYNDEKKSSVIISMIRGLSIDAITVVKEDPNGNRFAICDGAHRVRVLDEFMADGFSLSAKKADCDNIYALNGKKFSQLPACVRSSLSRKVIPVVTVTPTEYDMNVVSEVESAVVVAKNSCSIKMSSRQQHIFKVASINEDVRFIKDVVSREIKNLFNPLAKQSAIGLALNSSTISFMIDASLLYSRFVTAKSRDEFADRFARALSLEFKRRHIYSFPRSNTIFYVGGMAIICALFTGAKESDVKKVAMIAEKAKKERISKRGKATLTDITPTIISLLTGKSKSELISCARNASESTKIFTQESALNSELQKNVDDVFRLLGISSNESTENQGSAR